MPSKIILKAKIILASAEELDDEEVMAVVLGVEQKLNEMQLHVNSRKKEVKVLPRFHFVLETQ